MKPVTVAIDGPAGSGKSTVARRVAVNKGLTYIDSGALYRSVTLYFLREYGGFIEENIEEKLKNIELEQEFLPDEVNCKTYLNGKDVTQEIRDEKVTDAIGTVSDTVAVRNFINEKLRSWAGERSIIMDGRDIGSVVFPQADLKVYLDASVEIRAARRINEYQDLGKNVDESTVKNQIILRDQQDRERPFGALIQTEDALYLDSSFMERQEVIDYLCNEIGELQK